MIPGLQEEGLSTSDQFDKHSLLFLRSFSRKCLAVVETVVVDLAASAATVAEVAKCTRTWAFPASRPRPRLLSSALHRR